MLSTEIQNLRDKALEASLEKAAELAKSAKSNEITVLSYVTALISVLGNLQ